MKPVAGTAGCERTPARTVTQVKPVTGLLDMFVLTAEGLRNTTLPSPPPSLLPPFPSLPFPSLRSQVPVALSLPSLPSVRTTCNRQFTACGRPRRPAPRRATLRRAGNDRSRWDTSQHVARAKYADRILRCYTAEDACAHAVLRTVRTCARACLCVCACGQSSSYRGTTQPLPAHWVLECGKHQRS